MTRRYRKGGFRTVQVTTYIRGPHYDALQRYMNLNSFEGGNGEVIEQALERLPDFKKLVKEEQEAYGSTNKESKHTQAVREEFSN